jgi:hypothetical protein
MSRWCVICLLLTGVYAAPVSAAQGTVSGTVTRADTAAAVDSAIYLCTADADCYVAYTAGSGSYSINVEQGTYYVFNFADLVDEVYGGAHCLGRCVTATALTSGSAIVVASGATVSGVDLALERGGAIRGTITSAITSMPLSGITVDAYAIVNGDLNCEFRKH